MSKWSISKVCFLLATLILLSACQSVIRPEAAHMSKAAPVQLSLQAPAASEMERTAGAVFTAISPAVAFVETPAGTGSGVLIEHRYLLSNAHVVWPFEHVRVVFPDGSEHLDVPVFAWDLMADLALIGPLDTEIEPVALVDGETLEIGSDVYLIGYPAEIDEFPQPTITNGILSRVRNWDAIDYSFFQVDATITGGQSGGVLVTHQGDVVGISTFYYSEFGLAGSVGDALGRLNAMLGNDTGVALDARPFATGAGATRYTDTLPNEWGVRRYVLREPVDTEVEISVESVGKPRLVVRSVAGYDYEEAQNDEEQKRVSLTLTVQEDVPYIVEVSQLAETENSFTLNSSHPLAAYADPDDGQLLQLHKTLAANLDTQDDVDSYEIALKAGDVIEVTADSLEIDPFVAVEFKSATREARFVDDNSGGGIFGSNAQLIFKAPKDDTYVIQVSSGGYDGAVGGYFLTVNTASAEAEAAEPVYERIFVSSGYGRMAWYENEEHGYALLYPAEWKQPPGSGCSPSMAVCIGNDTVALIILEEDLSPLPKKERNRQGYLDLMQDMVRENPGVRVKSIAEVTTLQRLPADQLLFTAQARRFTGNRFVYVDEEAKIAFNVIFISATDVYPEMKSMMNYIFESFRHWTTTDRTTSPVFHLDEGTRLMAEDDVQGAIDEFTTSIKLDADLTQAYSRRAWAYRAVGDVDLALADLGAAIELEPENPDLYFSRAMLHWFGREFDHALTDVDQAIELNPDNAGYYNQRALINVSLDEYETALKDIDKVEELYDGELPPNVLDTRGFIYIKMGEFDKAKDDYDEIFAQDLRFSYALLGGGIAYANTGDIEQARALLQEGMTKLEKVDKQDADPQLTDLLDMTDQLSADSKTND